MKKKSGWMRSIFIDGDFFEKLGNKLFDKNSDKEEYVKICSFCGSENIKINFENPLDWQYGTPANYECKDCGNISKTFPEIVRKDIKKEAKRIKEHSKKLKLKPNKNPYLVMKANPLIDKKEKVKKKVNLKVMWFSLIFGSIMIIDGLFENDYPGMMFPLPLFVYEHPLFSKILFLTCGSILLFYGLILVKDYYKSKDEKKKF